MSDYLVKQAIQSVWCTPTQDRQSNIALAKISRYGGVYTSIQVMWRQYLLPEINKRYHIYQVGRLSPRQLGLSVPARAGMWLRFSDVCIEEKTIVDLYNVNGIQSPRYGAYYTVTADDLLIVAVEENIKIPIKYNEEQLYLRTYSNAYFDSVRQNAVTEGVDVQGMTTTTTADILALQQKYNAAKDRGVVYAFVNGYFCDSISLLTVKPGDAAEFVYDGSIYAVANLPVGLLAQFDSSLDLKRKYLLHPHAASKDNITYQDDIDVFLYRPTSPTNFSGVYYHRNQIDALRQVTHADYAISIPYLNAYAANNPTWGSTDGLVLRLHLRKSGYRRPLVNEANRIKELYRLPDAEIVEAMVSVNAVVPEWQAAHLEASAYTEIMRAMPTNITPKLVQDAFGYNSMSQYLAPTPQLTRAISGQVLVQIPPNLQYRSTVYEYDANGGLLEYYQHTLGDLWRAQADTKMVEILTGYGVTQLDERYGEASGTLDATLDYRMYVCDIVAGVPNNKWRDVTDSALYVRSGTGLTWVTDPFTTYTMVRSNRDFLAYDLEVPIHAGFLRFALSSEQTRYGVKQSTLMQVQMGELDVFLHGKALVEGVDYIVNFPEVMIINKKFLRHDLATQKVTVRFCGHAKADLSRAVLGDRGFVQHGVLSNNNHFDIRDDKVLHINVGGKVLDRSALSFAENHSGVNVVGIPNGTPYVIRDIVVPLRGTVNAKTYDLRDAALLTDKHVSDYLTLKLPPPTFDEINAIPERWPVYSPFISAMIDDLKSGAFTDARINGQYNDNMLREICQPYESLLKVEPTREPNLVDSNYVNVEPYYRDIVIALNMYQYRFLTRVVSLYLKDAVNLSHFITVTA